MNLATRMSWKNFPLPDERMNLGYSSLFDDSEAEKLMQGLIPEEMEDKWFIFFEDGWMYFHRSWSGICIFALRLDGCPTGVRVVESLVNRNADQYQSTDTDYDRKLVQFLIEALLLGKDVSFPIPTEN